MYVFDGIGDYASLKLMRNTTCDNLSVVRFTMLTQAIARCPIQRYLFRYKSPSHRKLCYFAKLRDLQLL